MRTGWERGGGSVLVGGRYIAESVDAVCRALEAERDRLVLWLPAAIGAGIAFYFGLPFEPPWWAGAAALGFGVAAALVLRQSAFLLLVLAVIAAAAGFTRVQFETHRAAAPVLHKKIGPATVSGRVIGLQPRDQSQRVLLGEVRISRLSPPRTPTRVRIKLRRRSETVRPGDVVRLRAILMPPPGPATPGAYDFARQAYFERIGAVGFAVDDLRLASRDDRGWAGFRIAVSRLRVSATERILDGLDPPAGAMAAALMTGERGAIPADVLAAMRDSGLAHLLAISGLHIGLVAGILFFGLRLVLSAFEGVALNYPIKKWAAVGALVGALGYLMISGATVPTQRAFLMASVVILAVLTDRQAISMRLVAWAAVVVLMLSPQSLLSASFHMSFAAVIALVALYEALSPRLSVWRGGAGPVRRVAMYFAGVLLTTLVAGLATAPFAAFHFNRLALYGLAANLVAIPLTGLWIMPWAIAVFVLMPLGLEGLALAPMEWGIDAVIRVARTVAGWPGAVQLVSASPTAMLGVVALGGLWLCLWRTRWRLLGLPVLLAGIGLAGAAPIPDVLIDGNARLAAVRLEDGQVALSRPPHAGLRDETWLRRSGRKDAAPWPRYGYDSSGGLGCDPRGCIFRAKEHVVAIALDRSALEEDCRIASVVIALAPVWRRNCRRPTVLLRPYDLWRRGTHAIWLGRDGVRVENIEKSRGARPWTRRRQGPG